MYTKGVFKYKHENTVNLLLVQAASGHKFLNYDLIYLSQIIADLTASVLPTIDRNHLEKPHIKDPGWEDGASRAHMVL